MRVLLKPNKVSHIADMVLTPKIVAEVQFINYADIVVPWEVRTRLSGRLYITSSYAIIKDLLFDGK